MATPPLPHEVRLETRGDRYLLPTCTCGWIGTARLTESSAREEARDHILLFAPNSVDAEIVAALVEGVTDADGGARGPARPDPAA